MEGYKDKLDVTLLPDWNPLNVSEIFTPSILVDKQMEDSHNLGSYKEIFYESDDLEKRVFLLGEAGTGKTTFSKHLTDVWCETATHPQFSDVAFLKQFHYFFNVSCRFSNKKETILDMINYQLFGDEKMQKVAEYVLKHYPECCLIVLDGADEWIGSPSSETGRRGDIAGLPGMTGVEDCVILITSRPWRFHSLSNKTQNMFRCLNIKGIKDQRELAYRILQQLREPDPEQSSYEFLSQVRDTSMSDLMKIPLILIIALDCWVDDKSFHKSMCINYINMIQLFIRRSEGQAGWSDSESKLRRCIPNLDKLEAKWKKQSNKLPDAFLRYESIQRFAGLFLSIGNIAFDLLLGKTEISLVFSKAALKTYPSVNDESVNVCLALGILSKTNINTCGLKKLESYAYCHKTFQEFFAALWLASNYSNEQSKLFICIKTVRDLHRYEILITFLCGIDSETGKKFWIDLAEKVEMKDMTKNERKLMKTELQKLSCKCMKEQGFDPRDQTSDQICFCIPHIQINQYTSNEDIRLLCHVMEENFCNIKSLFVFDCQSAQQVLRLYRSISSCSGLQSLNLRNLPTVSRQSDSLGSAVLDLQKHNKLEKLKLWGVCVDSLLLPIEGSRITKLCLYCVTVDHHSLELIGESLSSCYVLEYLYLHRVGCFEHNDSCSIPVLDLQTHYQLEQLCLGSLSVEGLLLPLVGARDTSLTLHSVTMSHHGLEQLGESLSSCSCLNNLNLEITCSEHSDSCCFSELDLQKLTKLENMELHSLSYAGLLLPMEGARITSLYLINITIDQHGLEKLQESMASCSSLKKLDLNTVTCSEHSDSYCPIVLDLQKHNKLEELVLWNLILECLLLPVGGARITSLVLGRITMTHHGLEYLETSLSTRFRFYMRLLYEVKCGEHSDSSCLPVLNLPKHNGLKQLGESMSSFFGLKKLGLKDYFFLFYTPPL